MVGINSINDQRKISNAKSPVAKNYSQLLPTKLVYIKKLIRFYLYDYIHLCSVENDIVKLQNHEDLACHKCNVAIRIVCLRYYKLLFYNMYICIIYLYIFKIQKLRELAPSIFIIIVDI